MSTKVVPIECRAGEKTREVAAVLGPNGAGKADGSSPMCARSAEMPDAEKGLGPMSTIQCDATLCTIGAWTLFRLPKGASAQLPSRGMAIVAGTINGARFEAPLEPDGRGSHWCRVDDTLRAAADADVGDTVRLVLEPVNDWPEPAVPADVQDALAAGSGYTGCRSAPPTACGSGWPTPISL